MELHDAGFRQDREESLQAPEVIRRLHDQGFLGRARLEREQDHAVVPVALYKVGI